MKDPILRGDLGLIGLFDLGQLLQLNGATGCLAVQNGVAKAYLYFEDGRLVNAVDEELRQGELAAYQIFAWKRGTFEFRVEKPTGMKTIQGTTDSVMLEAARRIDESNDGETPGTPEEQRLRDRRAALEQLRDAFSSAAGDPTPGRLGEASPLPAQLWEPGERLVIRPGRAMRLRREGRWVELEAAKLGARDYRELRARLLDACVALVEEGNDVPLAYHLRLPDGRTLAVEVVGSGDDEALWLRPVGLTPRPPAELAGDREALAEVLSLSAGLIFVGAQDLETARALLAALLSEMSALEATTILIASDDGTYACGEGPAIVLRVAPKALRATLRAVEPDVVALDPTFHARDGSLAELSSVSRVLAGVVAPDIASMPARWLARVAGRAAANALSFLAAVPVTLVTADGTAGRIESFAVLRLSAEASELALSGRTAALASLLEEYLPDRARHAA